MIIIIIIIIFINDYITLIKMIIMIVSLSNLPGENRTPMFPLGMSGTKSPVGSVKNVAASASFSPPRPNTGGVTSPPSG